MNKENTINLLQSDYLNEKIYESIVCSYEEKEGLLCATLEKVAFYHEDSDGNSIFYAILLKELFAIEIKKNQKFTILSLVFHDHKKMDFSIENNNALNLKFVETKTTESENTTTQEPLLSIRKDFVKSMFTYLLRQMRKSIKIDNDYTWNTNKS